MVVGLSVSLFQVVTSLQDQTVAFVPKIIAVMVVIVLSFPWMVRVLVQFASKMFTEFNTVTRVLTS
jgi:flagellar biosynthetic protein FliQ